MNIGTHLRNHLPGKVMKLGQNSKYLLLLRQLLRLFFELSSNEIMNSKSQVPNFYEFLNKFCSNWLKFIKNWNSELVKPCGDQLNHKKK